MGAVIDENRPELGGNLRYGDIDTFCPVIWRFLVERFAVRSVLDVGCGEGHAVAFFNRLGIFAHGIDGLAANVERSVIPIALHDLLKGPYIMPVDLVWSCEVAEHIIEEKVDNYLETLCNGRIVAMTHALPGQDGHHHVNCQPTEYWIDKMHRRGYRLSDDLDKLRKISESEHYYTYFRHSGLVFLRA
jgi:SAM-dependent methyltransferase